MTTSADKLAVSCIAWDELADPNYLDVLSRNHISNVEVAPLKIAPSWEELTLDACVQRKVEMNGKGFSLASMQGLTFMKPDLQLFKDGPDARAAFLAHLKHVCTMAQAVGARRLVFGSPRNRVLGGRNVDECLSEAVPFFKELAVYAQQRDTCVVMEANAPQYNTDFCTSGLHSASLVRSVGAIDGFALHLDSGCMHMAGDDAAQLVRDNIDILRHVHVSQPFLGDFDEPISTHEPFAATLRQCGYDGLISLEMRGADQHGVERLETAVNFLKGTYVLSQ